MKHFLPLSLLAVLLAGCADDNATNPWSTAEERAEGKAEKAAMKHDASLAKADAEAKPVAPVETNKYSWQTKKAAGETAKAAEEPKALEGNRAIVTAVRADAGLIQLKRSEPANPGDRFVLTKDGKSLLVIVSVVDGDSIIADIAPKQINTPAILVGEELPCVAPAEKTEEKK